MTKSQSSIRQTVIAFLCSQWKKLPSNNSVISSTVRKLHHHYRQTDYNSVTVIKETIGEKAAGACALCLEKRAQVTHSPCGDYRAPGGQALAVTITNSDMFRSFEEHSLSTTDFDARWPLQIFQTSRGAQLERYLCNITNRPVARASNYF